jgi:hypothetical protein
VAPLVAARPPLRGAPSAAAPFATAPAADAPLAGAPPFAVEPVRRATGLAPGVFSVPGTDSGRTGF